jgi:hypothetical protein
VYASLNITSAVDKIPQVLKLPTLDDIMRPYLHFPKTIQTALLRVETHPTFRALTKASHKVLKALVTRASETNGEREIWARLERVSEEAGCSPKTVQRAMRLFRDLLWVLPTTEGRSEHGVYCTKRYVFSKSFCDLVHLPTKIQKDKPESQVAIRAGVTGNSKLDTTWTEMSDGAVYVDLSLKEDQRKILFQRAQNHTPIQLPEELKIMADETSILETGICALRGLAHDAGYKLEDIYAVAKSQLAKLGIKAGRAYRYVQAIILNPRRTNFAAKVAQVKRLEAAQRATSRSQQYANQRYVTKGGGTTVTLFDGTAEIVTRDTITNIAGAQLHDIYEQIERGQLVRSDQASQPDIDSVPGKTKNPAGTRFSAAMAAVKAMLCIAPGSAGTKAKPVELSEQNTLP